MTQRIILIAATLLLLLGCSESEPDFAELPMRTIEVVIADTEVITLDGKELHISFFEIVLETLSKSYDLNFDLKVGPDAMTGVVMDVTRLVYKHKSALVYHARADEL